MEEGGQQHFLPRTRWKESTHQRVFWLPMALQPLDVRCSQQTPRHLFSLQCPGHLSVVFTGPQTAAPCLTLSVSAQPCGGNGGTGAVARQDGSHTVHWQVRGSPPRLCWQLSCSKDLTLRSNHHQPRARVVLACTVAGSGTLWLTLGAMIWGFSLEKKKLIKNIKKPKQYMPK